MERITDYLVEDHRRLDALLGRARDGNAVDQEAYAAFRAGLLRHIAIEEKVLFPAVQRARGGAPLPRAAALREDHGRIAALLASTPTLATCTELAEILDAHDAVEEEPDGVYAECEQALGGETSRSLAVRAREFPAVRVAAFRDHLQPRRFPC